MAEVEVTSSEMAASASTRLSNDREIESLSNSTWMPCRNHTNCALSAVSVHLEISRRLSREKKCFIHVVVVTWLRLETRALASRSYLGMGIKLETLRRIIFKIATGFYSGSRWSWKIKFCMVLGERSLARSAVTEFLQLFARHQHLTQKFQTQLLSPIHGLHKINWATSNISHAPCSRFVQGFGWCWGHPLLQPTSETLLRSDTSIKEIINISARILKFKFFYLFYTLYYVALDDCDAPRVFKISTDFPEGLYAADRWGRRGIIRHPSKNSTTASKYDFCRPKNILLIAHKVL